MASVVEQDYPGKGHPWADFLHYRAIAIDWLFNEEKTGGTGDDSQVACILSMTPRQVNLIRTRDRSIPV